MTSPTSAIIDRVPGTPRSRNRRSRRAFTLVEMLVVIGIMAALIGILAPTIMNAWQSANRTKLAGDLQAIASALDARKADFGDYPRVTGAPTAVGYDGARALCQGLIGPSDLDDMDDDDGNGDPITVTTAEKHDLGFRKRPGGKMYPPYLAADRFRMKEPDGTTDDPSQFVLLDGYDKPILYFPASLTKPNVRVAGGYVTRGEFSRYDANDNFEALRSVGGEVDAVVLKRIRLLFGDFNDNGTVDSGETPVEVPVVLWSAGADDLYGPQAKDSSPDAVLDEKDVQECDDVTNFRQ